MKCDLFGGRVCVCVCVYPLDFKHSLNLWHPVGFGARLLERAGPSTWNLDPHGRFPAPTAVPFGSARPRSAPFGPARLRSPAALRGAPPARPPLPSDSGAAIGGAGGAGHLCSARLGCIGWGEEEVEREREEERTQVQAVISRGKERNSDRSSSRATVSRTPLSSSSSQRLIRMRVGERDCCLALTKN